MSLISTRWIHAPYVREADPQFSMFLEADLYPLFSVRKTFIFHVPRGGSLETSLVPSDLSCL